MLLGNTPNCPKPVQKQREEKAMLKTIHRKVVIIGWLVFGVVCLAAQPHWSFLVIYAINTAALFYLMRVID